MEFVVKRLRGKSYVVEDDQGRARSEPLSLEDAQARRNDLQIEQDKLDIAERERVYNSPENVQRREEKKAYKIVAADPELQKAHKVLRELSRSFKRADQLTRESHQNSLKFIGGLMRISSGHPQVHAELNKSPGQHQTSSATKERKKGGASTRDEVRRLTEGKMSQVAIAGQLDIDVRTVRRYQKADKSSA